MVGDGVGEAKRPAMNRRETRKSDRQLKKVRRLAYASRKAVGDIIAEKSRAKLAKAKKRRKRKKKQPKEEPDEFSAAVYNNESIAETRRHSQKALIKEEEKEAKRMAKLLGYNKRKGTAIPKVFVAEGLDYLLEMCDPDKRKNLLAESDYEISESDSDAAGDNQQGHSTDSEEDAAPTETSSRARPSAKRRRQDERQEDASAGSDSESASEAVTHPPTSTRQKRVRFADVLSTEQKGDTHAAGPAKGEEEAEGETKADIYGRSVDVEGRLIERNPKAARQKLVELESSLGVAHTDALATLRKQIRALINKLSEATLHQSLTQLNELHESASRNDFKTVLFEALWASVAVPFQLPARLLMEYGLLIALLHSLVAVELSAYLVEAFVLKFEEFRAKSDISVDDKSVQNAAILLCHFCNFKIVKSKLILDLLNKLLSSFEQKDVEFVLCILTNSGFSIRKDDAIGLRDFIQAAQAQIAAGKEADQDSKMQFMHETLLAIKNNNVLKLSAHYDPTLLEHYHKLLRSFLKGQSREGALSMGLDDLLDADEKGRWWIVGSSFVGHVAPVAAPAAAAGSAARAFPAAIVALANKARMNTDVRRNVFCSIMSSQNCLEAFERLMRLKLKDKQEREAVHICLQCALLERRFNPFYALLIHKLCTHHKRFQLTTQYALWDRLRELPNLKAAQQKVFAAVLAELIKREAVGMACLKVIDFAELDSVRSKCLRRLFSLLLSHCSNAQLKALFTRVICNAKLRLLSDGLQLFVDRILRKHLTQMPESEDREKLLAKLDYVGSLWNDVTL